jgi:hypothetical protein
MLRLQGDIHRAHAHFHIAIAQEHRLRQALRACAIQPVRPDEVIRQCIANRRGIVPFDGTLEGRHGGAECFLRR